MGISLDEPEASVDSDGTLLVLLIPASGVADLDNPKVTEFSGVTAIDATYSLTADGWNHAATEDERDDDRLTLKQALKKAGRQTDTLSTKHVFGDEDEVLDPAIIRGEKYILAARYAVPHDTPIAAGQKFDILPVVAGRPGKDAPVANGRWTKTTKWRPFDDVRDDVVLTA